ncbi:MAG: M48 family metalloprotease [Tepidisphaeraceae bacterium]
MTSRNSNLKLAAKSLAVIAGLVALAPFNMGGCASDPNNPVSLTTIGGLVGGPEGHLISAGGKAADAASLNEDDENVLGQSVAVAITNQYPLVNDETLQRYVTLVGMTVADASPRPDANYVFGVLDTDVVNAYAGPGGYILITRGALRKMQDESELAGVLAHEVAHVTRQHGLKAAQQAGWLGAGVEAAKANQDVAAFGNLSDNLVDFVLKKGYSREQEFDADAEAVKYVTAAGYDPEGLERFLSRTQGGGLMSTHPGAKERAGRVDSAIAKSGGAKGVTNAARFLAATGRAPAPSQQK